MSKAKPPAWNGGQGFKIYFYYGSAKANAAQLTARQFNEVESILEDIYPDGIDETTINDIFWFEFETVAELALNDAGDLYDPEEEEEGEEEEV